MKRVLYHIGSALWVLKLIGLIIVMVILEGLEAIFKQKQKP